jgi:hypothetical protein
MITPTKLRFRAIMKAAVTVVGVLIPFGSSDRGRVTVRGRGSSGRGRGSTGRRSSGRGRRSTGRRSSGRGRGSTGHYSAFDEFLERSNLSRILEKENSLVQRTQSSLRETSGDSSDEEQETEVSHIYETIPEEKFKYFTNFTQIQFDSLWCQICSHIRRERRGRRRSISEKDSFMLLLIYLKSACTFEALASDFKIKSTSTV